MPFPFRILAEVEKHLNILYKWCTSPLRITECILIRTFHCRLLSDRSTRERRTLRVFRQAMKTFTMFWSLPVDVIRHNVLGSLAPRDILTLDSACTSRKLRTQLHEILHTTAVILSRSYYLESVLPWLVIRRMRVAKLIVNEELGDDLSVLSGGVDPIVESIEVLLSGAIRVERTAFDVPQDVTDRITRLVYVWARYTPRNCEVLMAAIPRANRLQQLGCALISTQPITPTLKLIRCNTQLRSLTLHCDGNSLSEDSLWSVKERLACLLELSVQVRDRSDPSIIAQIAQSCPTMQKMCIEEPFYSSHPLTVNHGLIQISKHCHDLRELTLKGYMLTENALVYLLTRCCPRLWKLDTPHAALTDRVLNALTERARRANVARIGYLGVTWAVQDAESITTNADTLARLDSLSVTISPQARKVYRLMETLSTALERCKALRRLDMAVLWHCANILHAVAEGCPGLQSLTVRNRMEGPCSAALIAIAQCCLHIHELIFRNDKYAVTGELVKAIALRLPQLRRLEIYYGRNLGAHGLPLIGRCLELRHLVLHSAVDGSTAIAIAEGCPQLEVLDLLFSHLRKAEAVSILSHCKSLRDLRLSDDCFSEDLRRTLCQLRKGLRVSSLLQG